MGKTETIKERAIYVYLPSIELVKRWKRAAQKQGTSVSKFVMEHVENSLRQEEEPGYKSRGELWKEIQRLREELKETVRERRLLEHVVEKLEKEVRRYRAQPFLQPDFEGVRRFQKELIGALKEGGIISSEELLSKLDIDPLEHEAVKAIYKQLEVLQAYGLVESSPRGWNFLKDLEHSWRAYAATGKLKHFCMHA